MCKFYGWSLRDIRELNIFDYNIAIKMMNEYVKEKNRESRKNKMKQRRR